jgi:hypothetical protein
VSDDDPQTEASNEQPPRVVLDLDELVGDYPSFDRENLPAEFTLDDVMGMSIADTRWVKDNPDALTPEQLASYQRAHEEMWGPLREQLRNLTSAGTRSKMVGIDAARLNATTTGILDTWRRAQTNDLNEALRKAVTRNYDLSGLNRMLRAQRLANSRPMGTLAGITERQSTTADPEAPSADLIEVPEEGDAKERVADLVLVLRETVNGAAQQVQLLTEHRALLQAQQETLKAVQELLAQQNRRADDERAFATLISYVFIATLTVTISTGSVRSWWALAVVAVVTVAATAGLHRLYFVLQRRKRPAAVGESPTGKG